MSLTIEQVKGRKVKLEGSILKLMQDFEKETEAFASYISTERKPSKKAKKDDISGSIEVPEPERDGPLINVTVDLRFDI